MIQKKPTAMVVKTPESQKMKTPQSKKKTPNSKLGGKRPLPDDSEDEEPEIDQSILKMKKMKRQEESDDSDPAVGSENESEEEVSNDDDSEGDDDEDDSEGDEDEDDDNEDDEDDDDEDEDDTIDKIDTKVSQKQKKTPAKGEGKQAPQQKATPQTTSKPSDTPKVAKSHVLLFNFDSLNESLLAGFLKKRGVNPQTLGCIYSPVALLGLPNDEAAKKTVSACSGATYNTRALSAVMVDGDVSKILTNKSKQTSSDGPLMTVFASNLPKSLTTEDIKKIISVEPKSMRLLTSGPKNRLFNACYIDCLSEADARKAFKALEGRSESGTNIRAFLKNQQQWPAVTETTLIITNAPFTIGVEQMKKEFPTATLVESTKKGSFHLTFKTKEDKEKAATKAKGKVMEGRPLRVVIPGEEKKPQQDSKPNSLVVSNLPFTAKIDEIRQLYPGCSWVTLKKRDDGKFNGTAVISFKSAEDAKKALNETPSKQVQGRQLRAHLESQQPEAPVKETPSKKEAKQTVTKEQKKAPALPAQVGSESEDDDDEKDEDESDEDDDAKMEDEAASDDEEAASDDDDEAASEDDDDDEAGSEEEDDSADGDEPESEGSDEEESAEAPPAKQPKKEAVQQNGPNKPFRGFGGNRFNGRGRGSPRGGRGTNGFRGGNNFRGQRGRGFGGPRGRGGGFKSNWRGGN